MRIFSVPLSMQRQAACSPLLAQVNTFIFYCVCFIIFDVFLFLFHVCRFDNKSNNKIYTMLDICILSLVTINFICYWLFCLLFVWLFLSGRPTSLIIDFSARATRIIPIIDGYTLNKAIVSTSRGGNWIDVEVKNEIDKSGMTNIFTSFLIFIFHFDSS